jgi:hypothetical protein
MLSACTHLLKPGPQMSLAAAQQQLPMLPLLVAYL